MMTKYITAIFTVLVFHLSIAQSIDKVKLDQYFQRLQDYQRFMGSVAITKNGEIVYTNTIGFAELNSQKKSDKNTQYRIGAVANTFTATLILKAIEENKITLDTKLSQFFPSIPNAEKITISTLLNHRSGIHDLTIDADYQQWKTQKKSETEILTAISRLKSDFSPDSTASYSDTNYILLSLILEKIYKQPYGEILKKNILQPANLQNTVFGADAGKNSQQARSYKFAGKWKLEPHTYLNNLLGNGALLSTPTDLNKFSEALFNGKIISKSMVDLMIGMQDHYGFGLIALPFNNHISYGHSGAIDQFTSIFGYFPEEKLGVSILSNGNHNYSTNHVALTLLNAAYNLPFDIPEFISYEVKPEDLTPYVGIYSSKAIPLIITIYKEDGILTAKTDQKPPIALDPIAKDKFLYEEGGIEMEFNPIEKTMQLKQGKAVYPFTKDQ